MSELERKVLERYPETEKEKTCRVEKAKRDWLRLEYKKQLIDEQKRDYSKLQAGEPEV